MLELKYRLWDYEGKQPPDSAIAVYCRFQPTDGSNEGQVVEVFWSVGQASDFGIDYTDGNLLTKGARSSLGASCNWAFVQDKFRKACGLPKGALSSDRGIRVLEGSILTLARVPQPKRQGLDDVDPPAAEGGKQARTRDILVPTRAVFPWEKGGTGAPAPVVIPTGQQAVASPAQTAPQAAPTTAPATAPAAAPTNGSGSGSGSGNSTLALALTSALQRHRSIKMDDLGKCLLEEMVGVDKLVRVSVLKESKDAINLELLAAENSWKFDGTTISAA